MALICWGKEMNPPKRTQFGFFVERYKFDWPVSLIDTGAYVFFRSVTAIALSLQDWADLSKIKVNGLLAVSIMWWRWIKLLRGGSKRATDKR